MSFSNNSSGSDYSLPPSSRGSASYNSNSQRSGSSTPSGSTPSSVEVPSDYGVVVFELRNGAHRVYDLKRSDWSLGGSMPASSLLGGEDGSNIAKITVAPSSGPDFEWRNGVSGWRRAMFGDSSGRGSSIEEDD